MSIRKLHGPTAALALGGTLIAASITSAHADDTNPIPVITTNLTNDTYVSGEQNIVVSAMDNDLAALHAQLYVTGGPAVSAVKGYTDKSAQLTIPVNWSTLADGRYFLLASARDKAGQTAQPVKVHVIKDTTKPTATLLSPTGVFVNNDDQMVVEGADNVGLGKIVANVYRNGAFFKSTQVAAAGQLDKTHAVTFGSIGLADGAYSIKYNATDMAGNVSSTGSYGFTLDNSAPTVVVKATSKGSANNGGTDLGVFQKLDLQLKDNQAVGGTVLNGVVKNVTANAYSDYNDIKPGVGGALEGDNTIQVFDLAGNATTYSFKLDVTTPKLSLPQGVILGKTAQTLRVTQDEANPARTYVEINQFIAGKWNKPVGLEFKNVNEFDLLVDPKALGLQEGVKTQLKVSTWDKAGNHTSATSNVVVDYTRPELVVDLPIAGTTVKSTEVGSATVTASDTSGLTTGVAHLYKDAAAKPFKSNVWRTSINDTSVSATFDLPADLPNGTYELRVGTTDKAGNNRTVSVLFYVDNTTVTVPDPQPETPTDDTPSEEAVPPFPMTAPAL